MKVLIGIDYVFGELGFIRIGILILIVFQRVQLEAAESYQVSGGLLLGVGICGCNLLFYLATCGPKPMAAAQLLRNGSGCFFTYTHILSAAGLTGHSRAPQPLEGKDKGNNVSEKFLHRRT